MNKKTTTIIIIAVVVLLVVVGGWYGYKKYREQRILNAYCQQLGIPKEVCKSVTSGNYPGIMPTGTPTPTTEGESANDVFNKASNMTPPTDLTKSTVSLIGPIFEKVFGGVKLSAFSTNVSGTGWDVTSYVVKRLTTAADINTLMSEFQNSGFTVADVSSESNYFSLTAIKDDISYRVSYEGGTQALEVITMKSE